MAAMAVGMKRAASASMKVAKKAKTDKDLKKASSIVEALKAAELPPAVVKTLKSIVTSCLSGYAGERHAFQETGLGMIGTALSTIEATEAKEVATIQAIVSNRDAELAAREKAITTAARDEAAKIGAAASKDADLTTIGMEVKHAEDALKVAVDAQKAGDKKGEAFEKKKGEWEKAKTDLFAPAYEKALSKKEAKTLDQTLAKLGMDASLVHSLETAVTKTVEERGEFDKVVLQNVESDIAAKIAELEGSIQAEAPGKAQRGTAKDAAQATYDKAKEKKDAAKAALTEAEKAVKVAEKAKKVALEKVANFGKEMKAEESKLVAATKKLEALKSGPLATFAALKARTPPPPPPVEETPTPAP